MKRTCPTCRGRGTVLYTGDAVGEVEEAMAARGLALEDFYAATGWTAVKLAGFRQTCLDCLGFGWRAAPRPCRTYNAATDGPAPAWVRELYRVAGKGPGATRLTPQVRKKREYQLFNGRQAA